MSGFNNDRVVYFFKKRGFLNPDKCSIPNAKLCHARADCVNLVGGYECRCQQGFIGDGFFCKKDQEFEKSILEPGGGHVDSQGFTYFAVYRNLKVGDAGVISSDHAQVDRLKFERLSIRKQRTEWEFFLSQRFT